MNQAIYTVLMPDIGEGVVEGEVICWFVEEGSNLKKDQPVVQVMTDKATVELPAPRAGLLHKRYFEQGQIAIVGKPLYSIAVEASPLQQKKSSTAALPLPDESTLIDEPPQKTTPLSFMKEEAAKEKSLSQSSCPPDQKKFSSEPPTALPSTRKIAKLLAIELATIEGSGPGGRIELKDLKQQITATIEEKPLKSDDDAFIPSSDRRPSADDIIQPISGVRRAMLHKMSSAKRDIPHFSYFERVDATRLILLRTKIATQAAKEGIHLTYLPFFLRALAMTAQAFNQINATVDPVHCQLFLHQRCNIGIAVADESGLLVPVLKDVQTLTLHKLIYSYDAIMKKRKEGKLTVEDMRDATITLSNFGVLGGEGVWATPIINASQVAILAIAKIVPMVFAVNGQPSVRPALDLSWSFDHRVIDGKIAAEASHYYAKLIKNPNELL